MKKNLNVRKQIGPTITTVVSINKKTGTKMVIERTPMMINFRKVIESKTKHIPH